MCIGKKLIYLNINLLSYLIDSNMMTVFNDQIELGSKGIKQAIILVIRFKNLSKIQNFLIK